MKQYSFTHIIEEFIENGHISNHLHKKYDLSTHEGQMRCVMENPSFIRFIDNPFKEVQEVAVSQDASFIKFIENPDEEIQLYAIWVDPQNMRFIKNPTKKARRLVINMSENGLDYIPKGKVTWADFMQDIGSWHKSLFP